MDDTSNTHPSIHPLQVSIHHASVCCRDGDDSGGRRETWPSLNFDGSLPSKCQSNSKEVTVLSLLRLIESAPPIDGYNLVGQRERLFASQGQRFSSRHSNSGTIAAAPPAPAGRDHQSAGQGCSVKVNLVF